jgi:hypothetical protein
MRIARCAKREAVGFWPSSRLEIPGGRSARGQSVPRGRARTARAMLLEERSAISRAAGFMGGFVRDRVVAERGAQYSGNCEEAVKNGPFRPFRG